MFQDTLPEQPDTLASHGYEREEGTLDVWSAGVKKVVRKRIERPNSELVFEVVIQYELTISDDSDATWEENCSYYFEEVRLVVRQRSRNTEEEGDEPAPSRRGELALIGTQNLCPQSFPALEQFATVLGYKSS